MKVAGFIAHAKYFLSVPPAGDGAGGYPCGIPGGPGGPES